MANTKTTGKMIIFFRLADEETLYGDVVLDDSGNILQFVDKNDKDIVFSAIESERVIGNKYSCEMKLNGKVLDKIQKQYPQLYKKITDYVIDEFYGMIIKDVMDYVKKNYPELVGGEYRKLVDDTLHELLQSYGDNKIEKMLSSVPLITAVELDEDK
jgi:hypothetical protein